ncbi:hypothetical protein TK34_18580 [Aeromonas hydrophila]|nr:hypothetical protein TK34_18580 [Aeromonas hydrophila]
MLEIGMMDLGLLIGEGELAGEMALLLASTPKISEFIKRSPLQGKLLQKRIRRWSEQLGEEMRHKPVPVALEQEYRLYQAHKGLPLAELMGRLPALLDGLEQYSANSTSKCDTRLCRLTVLFEYLDRLPESETFPRS